MHRSENSTVNGPLAQLHFKSKMLKIKARPLNKGIMVILENMSLKHDLESWSGLTSLHPTGSRSTSATKGSPIDSKRIANRQRSLRRAENARDAVACHRHSLENISDGGDYLIEVSTPVLPKTVYCFSTWHIILEVKSRTQVILMIDKPIDTE